MLNELEVMDPSEILLSHLGSQLIDAKVIMPTEDDIDEGPCERPKDPQTVFQKPKCLQPLPHARQKSMFRDQM